jgi:hypothetical protein
LFPAHFVFYWRFVNRPWEYLARAVFVDQEVGLKSSPHVRAGECRIKAGVGIVRIKSLFFERDAALASAS